MRSRAFLPVGFFLLLAGLVILRLKADPDFYITPDSRIYVSTAEHWLAGEGHFTVFRGQKIYNSIFPPGYPILIAIGVWLTGLSPVWASKLINLLALAGVLAMLYRLFGRKADWMLLLAGSSTCIQVVACTWSETVFLFTAVGFTATLYRFIGHPVRFLTLLQLWLWGTALFMVRYAGLYGALFLLLLVILSARPFSPHTGLPLTRQQRFGLLFVSVAILGVALAYWAYGRSVSMAGNSALPVRPILHQGGAWRRIGEVLVSSAQESLLFIRDWDIKRVPRFSAAFWLMGLVSAAQVGLVIRIGQILYRSLSLAKPHPLNRLLFLHGIVYYSLIVALYVFDFSFMLSRINRLYYRYYFPSTMLLAMALIGWLTQNCSESQQRQIRPLFIALVILSLFHSLPN